MDLSVQLKDQFVDLVALPLRLSFCLTRDFLAFTWWDKGRSSSSTIVFVGDVVVPKADCATIGEDLVNLLGDWLEVFGGDFWVDQSSVGGVDSSRL